MTETTALLRALHCDLAAVCNFLAALWYETGESGTTSMYAETASKALCKAGSYYRLADELEEKE